MTIAGKPASLPLAAIVIGLLGSISVARADCDTSVFNSRGTLCDNCRLEGQLIIAHDQTCQRSPEFSPREPVEFLGVRIVKRASHGVAGASGNGIAYAPAKGYSGKDDFEVEMAFRSGTQSGKYRVHWNVTVK